MPGPASSQPSAFNNPDYYTHWRYECKRCDVEGFGKRTGACWSCGMKDMLAPSWDTTWERSFPVSSE